jgi:Sulfotransferase family
MSTEPEKIIIIGAGRSGTNILRDCLTQFPGFGTWPCDEINYIWRYGNANHPTDELTPDHAREDVISYIRRSFAKISQKGNFQYVVEKTCANSMRVRFVRRVIPEAKFIFIVRDGRDVIASAMERWTASLDIPYIIKKMWYVPISDLPHYGVRYLRNRIHKLFSSQKALALWGPRFEGMDELVGSKSLSEVCAIQWVACVNKAERDLNDAADGRFYKLRYEDFVKNPGVELRYISDFLNVDVTEEELSRIVERVHSQSVGTWKTALDKNTQETIYPIIRGALGRFGYT